MTRYQAVRRALIVLAVAGVAAALAACRGGGANPGTVTIPVIRATTPPGSCQNSGYPAEAPQFGDNASFAYQEKEIGAAEKTVKLRYFDHVTGTGPTPAADSVVRVHYTGWLDANCIFDHTRIGDEPAEFPLSAVIRGWQEGISTMQVGGKRRLEIPPDLAYGRLGAAPVIPPNATLIFEVELVGILTPADATATVAVIITSTAQALDATATARAATATAQATPKTLAATPRP